MWWLGLQLYLVVRVLIYIHVPLYLVIYTCWQPGQFFLFFTVVIGQEHPIEIDMYGRYCCIDSLVRRTCVKYKRIYSETNVSKRIRDKRGRCSLRTRPQLTPPPPPPPSPPQIQHSLCLRPTLPTLQTIPSLAHNKRVSTIYTPPISAWKLCISFPLPLLRGLRRGCWL